MDESFRVFIDELFEFIFYNDDLLAHIGSVRFSGGKCNTGAVGDCFVKPRNDIFGMVR